MIRKASCTAEKFWAAWLQWKYDRTVKDITQIEILLLNAFIATRSVRTVLSGAIHRLQERYYKPFFFREIIARSTTSLPLLLMDDFLNISTIAKFFFSNSSAKYSPW
ncbi:hypothetical protein BH10BAC3_BH10BAC3_00700 [soil metagenome]